MKKLLLVLCLVFAISSSVSAKAQPGTSKIRPGFTIASGAINGAFTLSSKVFDLSIGYRSSKISADSSTITELSTLIFELGPKIKIDDKNSFLFGLLYFTSKDGKYTSVDLDSYNGMGIFVGIQHKLSDNLLLNAKYFPVSQETIKATTGSKLSSDFIGSASSFGITYLL
jgi:hypothetical protein